MLSGTLPFHQADNKPDIKVQIKEAKVEFVSRAWNQVSSTAKNLILKMLQKNPARRPTIENILEVKIVLFLIISFNFYLNSWSILGWTVLRLWNVLNASTIQTRQSWTPAKNSRTPWWTSPSTILTKPLWHHRQSVVASSKAVKFHLTNSKCQTRQKKVSQVIKLLRFRLGLILNFVKKIRADQKYIKVP